MLRCAVVRYSGNAIASRTRNAQRTDTTNNSYVCGGEASLDCVSRSCGNPHSGGGELEPIRGLANKLPEHAARIAAVLTFRRHRRRRITASEMEAGIRLAEHYVTEAMRLFGAGRVSADLREAQRLLAWLQNWRQPRHLPRRHLPVRPKFDPRRGARSPYDRDIGGPRLARRPASRGDRWQISARDMENRKGMIDDRSRVHQVRIARLHRK